MQKIIYTLMKEIYFTKIQNTLQICLKITVMCSSNITMLRLKFWKGMGGSPVGFNSLLTGGSHVPLSPVF